MRKLLTLLLLITLLISCSSDDDPINPTQEYTSFVVTNKTEIDMPNCIAGYEKEGKWIKIATLGDLKKGKKSPEIRMNDPFIKSIYIFTDYLSPRRVEKEFSIQTNRNNNFEIGSGIKGTEVDKNNPSQYPQ